MKLFSLMWVACGVGLLGMSSALGADTPMIEASAGGEKPVGSVVPKLARELGLKGSRGETINFVLKVSALKGCQPWGVSGKEAVVRLFAMPTIDVVQPSYPKAPLGKLYDPLPPLQSQICEDGWIWGELEILKNAKPGKHEIALRVGTTKFLIQLNIWKMTMPEVPSLPAYSEISSWNLLLAHYGAWHEGEDVLRDKYVAEMRRHRFTTTKSFIAKPPFRSKSDRPTLDLENAPSPSQSFKQTQLKNLPKGLYFDFPTIPGADIDNPDTVTYFKAVQNALVSLKRQKKAFVYLWDEPKPEEMASVLKLAKVAKTYAPDLKIMVTTVPRVELDPYVDIYVPVMDHFDARGFPDAARYKTLQKQGKEFWLYVSCMSHGCDALYDSRRPDFMIERPSSWVRSIGWVSKRVGADAFLYYSMNFAYGAAPGRDPWKSLWDFSGNGDGTLFYPARPGERGATEHGPVASIRLKLWRESSFDAEYIQWMEKLTSKPAWWESEFKALTKSTQEWERDYSKYQALRDKAGDYLDSLHSW